MVALTVARRFARNLDTKPSALPKANSFRCIYAGLRDGKVDQSVAEYKTDEFGPATSRESKFPASQTQNSEIENHGIYKANGKDLVVSVGDNTSALNPGSLEKNS